MEHELVITLADLREEETLQIVQDRLDGGDDPLRILNDVRRALEIVGNRFKDGEYFLPELVYSGEISKVITGMVGPKLTKTPEFEYVGKVVIGTVAGDIHDIGKNIVRFMLEVNGFEVRDLGVDVLPKQFVEEIEQAKPQILALSCLLTLAYDSMKETVQAVRDAGLRNKVKIMIGGGVVDETVVPYVGADGFESDAAGAVTLAKKWIGGN